MRVERKKKKRFIVYALLILGSIGFISFPSSYSYFTREEKSSLTYQTQLYNLSHNLSMVLERAKADTAQFKLSFKPSNAAINGQNDQYYIEIPDVCTFDHIDTAETVIDNNSHSKTITFNQNSNRNRSNYIYMNCPIDQSSDTVKFTAKINAKFSNESPKFTYIHYSYEESYNDYLKHVNEVVDSKISISKDSDIWAEFKKWITTYAINEGFTATETTKNPILNYVNQIFKSKDDLINSNNFNALPGLSITYDEAVDEYIFKIVDNFVGYARTYSGNVQNNSTIYLYFSTTSKAVIEEAFNEYNKKYIFPNSNNSVKLLNNYVTSKGGISSIILEGKTIEGMKLESKDTKNSTVFLYKGTSLSLALTLQENTPCVAPSDSGTMLYNDFPRALQMASGLSTSVMMDIYNRTDIQESVVKNNKDTTAKSFTDYFIHQNGNQYLLIKISSDITKDPIYNRIEIDDISIPSGSTITFNDTTSSLTITISNTSQSMVTQAVNKFDTYFKTTNNNLKVITNTSNNYTVELKYDK